MAPTEGRQAWTAVGLPPRYPRATLEAGAAAEMAATRKEEKYVDVGARYIFEPIAVQTLGVFVTKELISWFICALD